MSIANDGDERLKELETLIENHHGKDCTISLNMAIHGFYTNSEEYIKKCLETNKKYNLPVHIHFCENKNEVEDIKKAYNDTPANIIKKYFSDFHTILAHSVKLTDEDIDVLSKLNVHIAHCPISNLRLACGIAPISKMMDAGINIGLGSDGQGSGSNLDMFEVMKFAALLQKGLNEDPKLLPAYEVLKMATINGAKALGLEKKIGSIEVGKLADIIILNPESTLMKPMNDLISNIVYNAKGTDVETTIINGKIVMENRQIQINEQDIYKKCAQIIERIS